MTPQAHDGIRGATLQDFKQYGNSFYIWSAKHQRGEDLVFWRPSGKGYTQCSDDAGRYTARQAYNVTRGCTNSTGGGLLMVDRKIPIREYIKYGEKWGASFAIPVRLLPKMFKIRKVAKQ